MSKNDRIRFQTTPPVGSLSHARSKRALVPKVLALAVASCFAVSVQDLSAQTLPFGTAVIQGNVKFNNKDSFNATDIPGANGVLNIKNTTSPSSIVNFQNFSIGSGYKVQIDQQTAASRFLGKVVGANPSDILGILQSNGRVFLINPNGITFGAGAVIDVAGLVASSLDLSFADFNAGRMRFTDVVGAGKVTNNGAITTPTGGHVYLIAPNVENTGIITSPQGQVILAAGRSVELVDADTPNLRVEISAPDTEAVNVGQIIANSGKIGIYSGLIRNSGVLRADGVVQGANGEVMLIASDNITLEAGGVLSASGTSNGIGGGTISAEAGTISNAGLVQVNASDNASAGNISMIARDMISLTDLSRVEARGATVNSHGGSVYFFSHGNATADRGQVIDLSGGTHSGNAGNGEFSAVGHMDFAGTLLGSVAPGYKTGNFLIDPFTMSFGGGIFGVNTFVQSGDSINITGASTIGSNITLTFLADHFGPNANDWDDGRVYLGFGAGTVGIGGITMDAGAFNIAGNADGTSKLIMFAGGGGIGAPGSPVRIDMKGGDFSVFTTNPAQPIAVQADTFIKNEVSGLNLFKLDRGTNTQNIFSIESVGAINQLGAAEPIIATGLAVKSTSGSVNLSLLNLVDTLAGGTAGDFTFVNAKALTIGTVAGVVGIDAPNSAAAKNITVSTTIGALTVANNVSAASSSGDSKINLTSADALTVNAAVSAGASDNAEVKLTANGGGALTGTGAISAIASDAALIELKTNGGGAINMSGTILADAVNANATINLISSGTATVSNTVTADSAEFDALITISGNMVINGAVTADASSGDDAAVTLTSTGSMAINAPVNALGNDNATVELTAATSMAIGAAVAAVADTAASVTATATNGALSLGANVTADGAEGATINLTALNGAITRTAGVLQSLGGVGFTSVFNLSAANGIGAVGTPLLLEVGTGPSVNANNTASGNIVLSQAAGTLVANSIVNTAAGVVDLTAVGGNLTTNLVTSQGGINLTSGGLITVNDGAAAVDVNASGIVNLTADNMNTPGAVRSGAGIINVRTVTGNRNIFLGSDGSGTELGLSQTDITGLNGGNGVNVGVLGGANAISFQGPTTITGVINLFGTSVTQVGGATITGGLLVGIDPANSVSLPLANAIDRFSAVGPVASATINTTAASMSFGPVQSTGDVTVTSTGNIAIAGTVETTASPSILRVSTTNGAITDANAVGFDFITSDLRLSATAGIGTIVNPLETKVGSPISLTNTLSGDVGIINVGNVELTVLFTGNDLDFTTFGDLTLASLNFTGSTAVVEASGFMSVPNSVGVTASDGLALIGGTGLTMNRNVQVTTGDLILSGGAGDLHIAPVTTTVTVSARNITLGGRDINIDGAEGGPTTVHATQNLVATASRDLNLRGGALSDSSVTLRNYGGTSTITVGQDVNLQGGTGANSSVEITSDDGNLIVSAGRDVKLQGGAGTGAIAKLFGTPDVDITVGGVIRLNDDPTGAAAIIESGSDDTIRLTFLNCASGCLFVNGNEIFLVDGAVVFFDPVTGTGFVAGGSPAIFNATAIVEFGVVIPVAGEGESNESLNQQLAFIAGEINSSTDPLIGNEEEEQQQASEGPAMCGP